jgi:hypothetical protein
MASPLPNLFTLLQPLDWAAMREALTHLKPEDAATVMTTQGYVEVGSGCADGSGTAYARAVSEGVGSDTTIMHRNVALEDWPVFPDLQAVFDATVKYRAAEKARKHAALHVYACSPDSQIDYQKARKAELEARDALDILLGLPREPHDQ